MLLPAVKARGADGLPEVTAMPLTVTVASVSATVGVTVIDAVSLVTASV